MRRLVTVLLSSVLLLAPSVVGALEVPPSMNDKTLQVWQKKRDHYVEASNRMRGVRSDMQRYLKWAKDGPDAKAKSIGGIGNMKSALDRIAKAADENVAIGNQIPEIDTLLSEIGAHAKALREVNVEAYTYYSRKDYLADDMAKGKEMHPALVREYGELMSRADKLSEYIEELDDGMMPLVMAQIEKKFGKKYYWHHRNTVNKARLVMKYLPESVEQKVDAAAFGAAIADLAAAVTEFEEYAKAAGDGIRKEAMLPLTPNSFNSYIASARELEQDVKAGKKDRNYVRKVEKVSRNYNSLIDSANRTKIQN